MSNLMLIQSPPIFLFLHSGRMWLDQTVHEQLKKKENRWLSNVFMYSVKIQRKWEIDWDATKALLNCSFCYSILDKRSPNPLNSVQRYVTMHLGIASPLSTTCTLHSPKVYTLFKATCCLRGQIGKLCLNPQNHTLFSGDTLYLAK